MALLVATGSDAADHPIEGDSLRMRDPGIAKHRRARFRASREAAIDVAQMLDPRLAGATVEITGSGLGDGASGPIFLDPALWTGLGNPSGSRGYRYLDPSLATGVRKVLLRQQVSGGRIVIVARRENWPYTITQPQESVRVRFEIGGEVYCTRFTTFTRNEVKSNGTGVVIAKSSIPPLSCSCGNGIEEPPEECDDGNVIDGDGCDTNCTDTACGNGIVTAGEECDDGNTSNEDACTSSCLFNVCGDGHVRTGVEECDDGNPTDGDGCDTNCTSTACGNGIVTAPEDCDDGGASATCDGDCTPAECGDGTLNGAAGEECDDGGTDPGDGCDDNCQVESADVCAGVPTVSGTALDTELVASGLSSPVYVTAPPGDVNRIFIVQQNGFIRIVENSSLLGTPFLNIDSKVLSGGEQGLFSLAFHPDYETNGRFFVHYTNNSGNGVIARYEVSGDANVADAGSEVILLTITQPYSNHNGGQLAFGPDGYLYAAMGDGGSGGDPEEYAQNDASLLGKMLRMDVDVETSPFYAVPASNPNPGAGAPLGLIWAKGLRNPWRFSFDRETGDIYIGDVGQNVWEEIDFQLASSTGGENYGWDVFEGDGHCFDPQPHYPSCPDPPTGFTMPVHEYNHSAGACSVTGGFVYRGCRMPDLHGTYFYADYCAGFVRTFEMNGGVAQNHADRTADLAPGGGLSINNPASFGEDARGELYICDQNGGEVYRIVPQSP